MKSIKFEFQIEYSLLAVFRANLENPFNDWNRVHVMQGFTWREGSVSFGTLSDYGNCEVEVKLSDEINISDNIERAIVVPFYVEESEVVLASMDYKKFDIPKGIYSLLFTAEYINGIEKYTFSFIKSDKPYAKVLKADKELNVPEKLLMKARAATFD